MALRAKLYFERHIIFMISRSEIIKMMCLSKEYSAAAGGEMLFTQPQTFLTTLKYYFLGQQPAKIDTKIFISANLLPVNGLKLFGSEYRFKVTARFTAVQNCRGCLKGRIVVLLPKILL